MVMRVRDSQDNFGDRRQRRLTRFEVIVGMCTIAGLMFTVAAHYGWL